MIDISEKHILELYKEHGGYYSKQSVILIEEMSELTKELCKVFRDFSITCSHPTERRVVAKQNGLDEYYYILEPENQKEITEEMAHVYICLESVRKLMDITDTDIQKFVDAKEVK